MLRLLSFLTNTIYLVFKHYKAHLNFWPCAQFEGVEFSEKGSSLFREGSQFRECPNLCLTGPHSGLKDENNSVSGSHTSS